MDDTIEKQIKAIEDEIFNTQKNKATEHHIGKLKAKIARLKNEAEKRSKSGTKGKGFAVKKTGDATVGIIGFPSIGKSTLLNQLTDAESKTGSYDFTTLDAIPGMLQYKGADIQLLDLPGMITGAAHGKGRGREILSAIRSVDLILLMIDALHLDQLDIMVNELYEAGIRLNQTHPDIVIVERKRGGIYVKSTVKLAHLSEELIKTISSEFIINADITVRQDITEDQLIDVFGENRVYVSAFVVVNKMELVSSSTLYHALSEIKGKGWDVLPISAFTGEKLDELREWLFRYLKLKRVYMKPVGKEPDFDEPLILREGGTVEDACKKLHRDFKRKFRYALIWGTSAKHPGQNVGFDHVLHDEDILTIVLKTKM
jgi:small GTP-binding protein